MKTRPSVLEADAKQVLVLWLDASAFGDAPLAKMEQVLAGLELCGDQSPAKARVVMIGPASSDDLFELLNEKVPSQAGCLRGMAIYSPWATATWPPGQASVAHLLPAGIQFVRMIGTDESLMPPLGRELQRRGVKFPLQTHTIAVVHELDTSYGRDIVASVSKDLCRARKGDPECVYSLGYLRGIDGKIPRRPDPKEAPGDAKTLEVKPGPLSGEDLERAEGDSQFDHLRRLAARMRSEHERLVRDGKPGIRAVGVFGSDLYDKLLVLQAVRQEFPTVPFFTTDLDARYMHPRPRAQAGDPGAPAAVPEQLPDRDLPGGDRRGGERRAEGQAAARVERDDRGVAQGARDLRDRAHGSPGCERAMGATAAGPG